ncbi:MAG: ABC transporter permease [Chloroflexi bacterium]|nr:ABC transporter permease [Chloroflexota bacterium]
MRVFFASAYYGYRGLFFWETPTVYLTQRLLLPLSGLAFFSLIGKFGGSQPLEFYLIGNAMVIASLSGFTIGTAIGVERNIGTLIYLIGSPANRVALFFGRAAVHVAESAIFVVAGFGWAILVFGLDLPLSTWPGILLTIIVGTLAVSGLGLLLGAVAYVMLDAGVLGNIVIFMILLVSGANVPLSELPTALSVFGEALPLTRSIEAAREVAAGGGIAASLPLLLKDLGVGLAYASVGFILFSWIEVIARRRGTLENM